MVSGTTNTLIATVMVGKAPNGIAFDPDNGDVYVANAYCGTFFTDCGMGNVSVIDSSTNTVTATVPVGRDPEHVAFDPVNGDVYVSNGYNGTISIIDGSTNTVISTITTGGYPEGMAFDSLNGDMYVANDGTASVSVIDGSTNTVITSLNVGPCLWADAFDSSNGDIYVGSQCGNPPFAGIVYVIDGSTNTVTASFSVNSIMYAIAFDISDGDIYVPTIGSGVQPEVAVIDGNTNSVASTMTIGLENSGEISAAYDPANGDLYVGAGGLGPIVSVFSTVQASTLTSTWIRCSGANTLVVFPSSCSETVWMLRVVYRFMDTVINLI